MAQKIVTVKSSHNCIDEVGSSGYDAIYDGVRYLDKQPAGLVTRCSCGTLWRTKKYLYSFSKWVKAGPYLMWKHRRDGWDNGLKEEY